MVYSVALFRKIQYKHKADSLLAACLVFVLSWAQYSPLSPVLSPPSPAEGLNPQSSIFSVYQSFSVSVLFSPYTYLWANSSSFRHSLRTPVCLMKTLTLYRFPSTLTVTDRTGIPFQTHLNHSTVSFETTVWEPQSVSNRDIRHGWERKFFIPRSIVSESLIDGV